MQRNPMRFATIAAFAASIALAQTPAPRPRALLRHRIVKALDLTNAQKQQAKTIFQQAKLDARPLKQELQQNRQALATAAKANDAAQIRQLATQQGNVTGQLVATRAQAMARFYATLTPEQRAKADKVQQRIQQRLSQRKVG